MKKTITKNFFQISFCVSIILVQVLYVHAAVLILDAPVAASTNGEPFSVTVYVDAEGDTLSAVGGVLTFDTDIFDVQSITTRSSVVSLWVTQPKLSNVDELDGKTSIPFEGIIPGGYVGVRSPYYKGIRPGPIFIVTLLPKKESASELSLDSIEFHLFDEKGTSLKQERVHTIVNVPQQSIIYSSVKRDLSETYSPTLLVQVERDKLIANNAWYIAVNEDESTRPIDRIFISETNEYSAHEVKDSDWKEIKNMYVLSNQSRSKYIHVKVLYENNTYMIKTIPPVENHEGILYSSRILVSIVFLVVFLYLYGKKYKNFFSSTILQSKKKSS